MGGLKIIPDMTLEKVDVQKAGLLLLPGGATWLESIHKSVFDLIEEFLDADIPVAAICGATVGLADNGFLNHRHHTSNDLNYLKAACLNYTGEEYYVQQPAVTNGNLITASGIAPLEFAHAIFNKLDVFHAATLEAWYQLYQTHKVSHYYALMESLSQDE
jgi:putative intracellular protease/amidase